MTRQTRRSVLAAAGTAVTTALAGCSGLNPLSSESRVEYDDEAIAALAGDLPEVPPLTPAQPPADAVAAARDRIRSLLEDADLSEIPNEAVRRRLVRERDYARDSLEDDETDDTRVGALAGLTHPRSEAMFVHAGVQAFEGNLGPDDIEARRQRHVEAAESFLADYAYVGPADDPVAAFAAHAKITDWGQTGARIARSSDYHEYENTVLHTAELAQGVEWGHAYATDARRFYDHYAGTLDATHDYAERFARVADDLVADVEDHATRPDWDDVTGGFDRNIEGTAASELLQELAGARWNAADTAVERRDDGHVALAVGSAMRALTLDRAFADATDAIADGAYGVPESTAPIAAEREAAVEALRTLLDTSPGLLARRPAAYAHSHLQSANRSIEQDSASSPGHYLYSEYANAHRYAAAAPPVVQRVADALGD
ncbi:hypothetical protein [Halobacterium sp. CBA1126]|uniref:hypothetical protein n=1 Tax=Halobacterium TaxID=2239 RepID=UPI0012FA700F|nr:hypothetical protein [Halobacterium sp. CBA1126]MUV59332.1 hypothetical protein [Halobacterium sp. CBA1126]